MGTIKNSDKQDIVVDESFLIATSVVYDAVYIPGGSASINTLQQEAPAIHFIREAYKHCKAIAADKEGVEMISTAQIAGKQGQKVENDNNIIGVLLDKSPKNFIDAIAQHRFWKERKLGDIPA